LTERERLNLLVLMAEVLVAAVRLAVEQGDVWTALAWADQIRAVLARQNALIKGLEGQSATAGEALTDALVRSHISNIDRQALGHREVRRDLAHRDPKPDAFDAPLPPLMAVKLAAFRRAAAEKELAEAIHAAREAHLSWRELGAAIGTSGEAARQRYAS
jgi:hypothetical protein